jgi:hypothetical protein
MECCSPDVGDCQKCHPELWIQKGSSYTSWISKEFGGSLVKGCSRRGVVNGDQRLVVNGGQRGPAPFNRTRSKPSRLRVTRKKRIY